MKPSRVWQGVRLIGLNMAQGMYSGGQGECIFLDCMDCDQSIKLYYENKYDNLATTDREALKIFRQHGWAVSVGKSIRCPKCRKKVQ